MAVLASAALAATHQMTIMNNCPFTVWPTIHTTLSADSLAPIPLNGFNPQGWQADPQASAIFTLSSGWSGRIWGRTGCTGEGCDAPGNCPGDGIECSPDHTGVPPATLAEFTMASIGGQDNYDLSLVDGYNLPIGINSTNADCASPACTAYVDLIGCPAANAITTMINGAPQVVGCLSQCALTNNPQDCCAGQFNTPETCPEPAASQIMKNICPDAYAWAYNDQSSLHQCQVDSPTDYTVTFCP